MPIYMKYDGVDGDITAKGYEKWIGLESCQLGANRNVTSPGGRGANREASAVRVSEISCSKTQDCSSMGLLKAALWGEGKKVNIHFVKTDKDKVETFLEIELENTMVTSFSFSGHGGEGNSRPMEMFSLNFLKITVSTKQMGDKNQTGKPDRAMWNLAELKGA